MWGALSDERTGLSFKIAAGPRQRSHSRVRVQWDSRPYFTFPDSGLPFRRLLQLTGLRWRYLTPPPHGILILSQSQSYIATDGRSISKSWCRAPSVAHDKIFIIVRQLRSCFCEAPSLTRGRVCILYMMLALASAVFRGSESLGSRDHILPSQF
jgi:hypothetical protein